MLNDRLSAARRIADQLIPAEADLEAALLRANRLAIAIIEGRQNAKVPITMGQKSLVELGAATVLLIEARGRLAATHAALADDRIQAGLKAFGMGDVSECPPTTAELVSITGQVAA